MSKRPKPRSKKRARTPIDQHRDRALRCVNCGNIIPTPTPDQFRCPACRSDRGAIRRDRAEAGGSGSGVLTMLEFQPADFTIAERVAEALGYKQYPYTSTSALWALFCLPENPEYARPGQAIRPAAIIKTRELGFLVVSELEDLGLERDGRGTVRPARKGDR